MCLYRIVFLLLSFVVSCKDFKTKTTPKAIKGVLDLRGHDFHKNPIIKLDGEWEFYWKQFCSEKFSAPGKFCGKEKPELIKVPAPWNDYILRQTQQTKTKPVGGKGYATYRLQVWTNNSLQLPAIKMNSVGSAYELWVNGEFIGSGGKVAKNERTSYPGENHLLYYPLSKRQPAIQKWNIIFKISNYHHKIGGLRAAPSFGEMKQLAWLYSLNIAKDVFLFGSILIMGLYHLGLYSIRRKEKAALWFGIYCLMIALRIPLTGDEYLGLFFPSLVKVFLFVEYFEFALLVPVFALFVYSLFPRDISEKAVKIFIFSGIVLTLPVLLLPSYYYTQFLTLIQTYILIAGIYALYVLFTLVQKDRRGARIFLVGWAIFFATIFNDILYYQSMYESFLLIPFGLFVFIFSQAVVLSMRFSSALNDVEDLSNNLEKKVETRTLELERSKKEVEALNHFTYLINSKSNLNEIFIEISKYFYNAYGIQGTWLFLPDKNNDFLYAYKAYSYHKLSEEKYQYLMNKRVPLDKEGGMLYLVYKRLKSFYLHRIRKFQFSIDEEFVKKLGIQSFLHVPLQAKGSCVGIYSFANISKAMKLTKPQIREITVLCNQVSGVIETAHLLQNVEDREKEIYLLNEISKSANSNLDLHAIVTESMKHIREQFDIDIYFLSLVDKARLEIKTVVVPEHLQLAKENSSRILQDLVLPLYDKEHVMGYVYQARESLYTRELNEATHKTEKAIIDLYRLKSYLCVPVFHAGEIIGFLGFSNYDRTMDLEPSQIQFLEQVALQIGSAIYNSELYNLSQEQKNKTEELNGLIKKINESSDLEKIMKLVLEYVKEKYKFPYYSLFVLNPGERLLKFATAELPEYVTEKEKDMIRNSSFSMDTHIHKQESIHARSIQNKEPLFILDAEKEIKTEGGRRLLKILKHKSFITIPIFIQNTTIGTLDFISSEILELTSSQITELTILADQLSGVIQGSLLYKEIAEEKEKALLARLEADAKREEADLAKQEIAFLNDFARLINSAQFLEEVFHHGVLNLRAKLGANLYFLQLVDKGKEELFTRCLSAQVSDDSYYSSLLQTRFPLQEESGSSFITYKRKKTLYLKESKMLPEEKLTRNDREFKEYFQVTSILQIPLIVNTEVIGIMHINQTGGMRTFSKKEIAFVESLCEQIAIAVHKSHLYEIAEKERKNTEKQKRETEELNQLIKSLNQELDLKVIMQKVKKYIQEKFGFNYYALYKVNSDKTHLDLLELKAPDFLTLADHKTISDFKIPIGMESGTHSYVFKKKQITHLPRIKKSLLLKRTTKEEQFIIEKCRIKSFIMIPLILNEEVIGILDFSNPNETVNVSKEDITRFSILGEQLAGIIYGSNLYQQVQEEKSKSEKLLLNILPRDIANELKEKGASEPIQFDSVSVMFTDFKGFTQIAETLTPKELVKDLDACFVQFDKISERYNLEKLKTIGDSYMCAGGIPRVNPTHAVDCAMAAIEIQDFMNIMKKLKTEKGFPYWEIRLGIHTGPLVAGVIGEKKFAYDVWGDTVNTASRMESSGTPGKINISGATYDFVKDIFECEYRGKVRAKNKGEVDMHYLYSLKPEFSKDEQGRVPNGEFWKFYGGFSI
ncbi:MAG: adenylate/guanylate cyclase domain-containing protein [Spirochaetota bacterium]